MAQSIWLSDCPTGAQKRVKNTKNVFLTATCPYVGRYTVYKQEGNIFV